VTKSGSRKSITLVLIDIRSMLIENCEGTLKRLTTRSSAWIHTLLHRVINEQSFRSRRLNTVEISLVALGATVHCDPLTHIDPVGMHVRASYAPRADEPARFLSIGPPLPPFLLGDSVSDRSRLCCACTRVMIPR